MLNVMYWCDTLNLEKWNIIVCHAIQSSNFEYPNANTWKYVLLLTIVINYDDIGDGCPTKLMDRGGNHEMSKLKYQFYQLYW